MRLKRLIKLLERLLKKDYLYDEDQLKLLREQLKVAKNELATIEEKTSKGFKCCLLYTSPSPRDRG